MRDAENEVWMTLSEFEDAFWKEGDRIRTEDPKVATHGAFYPIRNPSRSAIYAGKKHVDEWLPLLMLLKHEVGRFGNWDKTFLVSPTYGTDRTTSEGKSYDARVQVRARQPDFDEDRHVWIEIVRAVSAERSQEMVRDDALLSRGDLPTPKLNDVADEINAHIADVRLAIAKKLAKPYPDPTALIVWIPQATSPWLAEALAKLEGSDLPEDGNSTVSSICVIGESTGCHWIKGSGL